MEPRQPIAHTMCLIYADLKEQCLDSKSKLCTIKTNIFITRQHSSLLFSILVLQFVSFFSQKAIICYWSYPHEIQPCCSQWVFALLYEH